MNQDVQDQLKQIVINSRMTVFVGSLTVSERMFAVEKGYYDQAVKSCEIPNMEEGNAAIYKIIREIKLRCDFTIDSKSKKVYKPPVIDPNQPVPSEDPNENLMALGQPSKKTEKKSQP